MLRISWDYFTRVRRLDVPTWLRKRNVKCYADLVERLRELGVQPPTEDVYRTMVPSVVVTPAPKPEVVSEVAAVEVRTLEVVETPEEPVVESSEGVKPSRRRSRGNLE